MILELIMAILGITAVGVTWVAATYSGFIITFAVSWYHVGDIISPYGVDAPMLIVRYAGMQKDTSCYNEYYHLYEVKMRNKLKFGGLPIGNWLDAAILYVRNN